MSKIVEHKKEIRYIPHITYICDFCWKNFEHWKWSTKIEHYTDDEIFPECDCRELYNVDLCLECSSELFFNKFKEIWIKVNEIDI